MASARASTSSAFCASVIDGPKVTVIIEAVDMLSGDLRASS
jgi:hypothetical protein